MIMVWALQSSDFIPLAEMWANWQPWQRTAWRRGLARRYLYA
jgi:hypothetical protein